MSDDTYHHSLEERLCNLQRRMVAAEALITAGILEDDNEAIGAGSAQLETALQQIASVIEDIPATFANWCGEPVDDAVVDGGAR